LRKMMPTGGEVDWVIGKDYFQQTMLQYNDAVLRYFNDLLSNSLPNYALQIKLAT
jgi:hypothetical protein